MRDDHVLRTLLAAPRNILGGSFLFIAAVLVGQIGFQITQSWGQQEWWPILYVPDFPFLMLFVFGFGAMSGIGFIFLLLDFWWIYRLMYKDEPAKTFFFAIIGNQVALGACSLLVERGFLESVPSIVVASILLWLTYHDLRKRVLSLSTEI